MTIDAEAEPAEATPAEAMTKVDDMDPSYFKFNDTEFFAKRKADFVIEFRKEPPKTMA